jgi:hypothetical protein
MQPTIQTRGKREKSAPPLFLGDENIFQKSAPLVPWGIEFPMKPTEPIFEKCSHLREKGGGADAFENEPSVISKPTVLKFSIPAEAQLN